MIGLDCNILVQLAIANHPANPSTLARVKLESAKGEKLVFPTLVATEFLHVVTDPRRIQPPLTMVEAIEWLRDFLKNPSVGLLHSNDGSIALTFDWMLKFNLGRKRILDTHLASILHVNGVARLMTSNPKDFEIFPELNIVIP
jgi:predicted nucleic acid-binding protein